MHVKVLKAFPYAHDHHNIRHLEEGAIVDIDESVLEGLRAEKFIGEASAEEIEASLQGEVEIEIVEAPVEIPEDWETLDAIQLAALARAVGLKGKITRNSAEAAIRGELARRAAQ